MRLCGRQALGGLRKIEMTEQLFTFCSSSFELPCSLKDLPTPCLLVDEDVVRSNCESMLQKAAQARVYLRPHVKTHKCREIALMPD